jgi:signal transduction histidine kinase
MSSRILIVEDEQLVALDIRQRLTQLGHQVVAICDRTQTTLEAVDRLSPDLILMDIHLKGEDNGIATAIQIKAKYHLPVIFLTAHADEKTVAQAKETQPFGYLVKPVQTKHLSTAIEIALTRHQAEIMMQRALEKERELNDALQVSLVREKELSDLKSQFISMVSHEFRNPLSAILFTLSLLEKQETNPTSERLLPPEKWLAQIKQAQIAAHNLTQLVEDILTLSKTEALQFQYQPTPIDVVWFCQELVEAFQLNLEAHHSILLSVCGCPKNNAAFYNLDAKLLRHILTNLLSNAIKYSPKGGEIRFNLICEPDTITFQMQDPGIGITPKDQSHLFEPFYRGSNVSNISGNGLGLSIIKKCVEAHQGNITLESEIGKGSTFTVILKQSKISDK